MHKGAKANLPVIPNVIENKDNYVTKELILDPNNYILYTKGTDGQLHQIGDGSGQFAYKEELVVDVRAVDWELDETIDYFLNTIKVEGVRSKMHIIYSLANEAEEGVTQEQLYAYKSIQKIVVLDDKIVIYSLCDLPYDEAYDIKLSLRLVDENASGWRSPNTIIYADGSNGVTISLEDFSKLDDETKNNGTMYFIYDYNFIGLDDSVQPGGSIGGGGGNSCCTGFCPLSDENYDLLDDMTMMFYQFYTKVERKIWDDLALTREDIIWCTSNMWDGVEAKDRSALKALEIVWATSNPWDGQGTTDITALTPTDIEEAINNNVGPDYDYSDQYV